MASNKRENKGQGGGSGFKKEELERELNRFSGEIEADKITQRAADADNMSNVIARFAAPLIPREADMQVYSNAIRMACHAWNVSFIEDPAARREAIREVTRKLEPTDRARLITARQILGNMSQRRIELFQGYNERVIRYDIKPVSGGWALLVAAAPPSDPNETGPENPPEESNSEGNAS